VLLPWRKKELQGLHALVFLTMTLPLQRKQKPTLYPIKESPVAVTM